MPSHYTLRMQFGLHQDAKEIAAKLLGLVRAAQADEIAVFFFAEEMNEGHETPERIRRWIEHSRPYREALAAAGVAVSLNPWHSVLHCDRSRRLKAGQDWQTMVGPDGGECRAVVCPLDKGWRQYYEETLRLYAREGFRVIWIDDDIRYANHSPLTWGGCFCPLHVAEFNRRAGTTAAREEIVAKCTAAGPPHPWRGIWMDMWDDEQVKMISHWREIVEAGGSRLGLMSSGIDAHAMEGRRWQRWWEAFGGGKPPVHRPNFWAYSDTMGKSLPSMIGALDQNRALQPAGVESGPEVECFPYGPWNKSFRQIGAQMVAAHVLGSTNLNISLYDFMGNDPGDEPERAEFLRRWRPTLDWLADEFPMTMRTTGIGIPWSEDMGRKTHTDGSGTWRSLMCRSLGWANWLGAIGHSFTVRPAAGVNAVAGPVAWSFSDEELRSWLSQGLLLDGGAGAVLVERGFGELIGVKGGRMVTQADVLYAVEQCIDGAFALRTGAQISVNAPEFAHPYAARLFQGELAEGAQIVSDLRDPTQKVVGHGVVLFENALGGRVALMPWDANAAVYMTVHRAAQLRRILRYLDPGHSYGNVEGGAWLVPQFLSDGEQWRGAIWNASPDAVEAITVHPPAGMG